MNRHLLFITFVCFILLSTGCKRVKSDSGENLRIAFSYHALAAEDITYLSHFDIVVTGNFVDADTTKYLKTNNVKLLYYDWLPAMYYCKHHDDWDELIYEQRFRWTLDPNDADPNPLGEKYGCMDLFYDMADDEFADVRADHIEHLVKTHNYDGVFFDWGSGWNEFEKNHYDFLMKGFSKRHPDINYNDKVNEFIKKLKKKGLLVMLNGGFRSDQAKLDTYADYDVVESMFTAVNCNNAYYNIFVASEGAVKVCDTWFNDVQRSVDLATRLPAEAGKANPTIKFLFLNYAFPYYKPTGESMRTGGQEHRIFEKTTDRQAIFYALACSYIGKASGFTAGNGVNLDYVKDDVYLHPPGPPVSGLYRLNNGVYVRYFSRGIVVVSDSDAIVEITLPRGKSSIFDLYEKRYLEAKGNKLRVSLISQVYPSGLKHSIGRIYLYDGH